MLDLKSEVLLTLQQAADLLPRRRRGRKAHLSTLYRWSSSGCRGVHLETIQVGATRCTSKEALDRFFGELTVNSQAGGGHRPDPGTTQKPPLLARTAAQRQRAADQAEKQLRVLGV